jgi:FAD/FMN-containing dehydrogenase
MEDHPVNGELFRSRTGHDAQVDALVRAAKARDGRQLRLAKRTSNLFRERAAHKGGRLAVRGLDKTISVSPEGVADVQGMATFEDFADACLSRGFVPPVVPELKTITIGGAATGIGIESSSFRRGFVHETVEEMDILCGDGVVRTCRSEGPDSDLFHAFPNSYGTLGYAMRLKVRLDKARRNVRLTYRKFDDAAAFLAAMAEACRDGRESASGGPDFVEGVAFGPDEYVLSTGWRTDDDGPVSPIAGAVPYYKTLRTKETDLLTARDHLWRWDADWFWCSRPLGFQKPLVRALVPRKYLRSTTYMAILKFYRRHKLEERIHRFRKLLGLPFNGEEPVIQDVEIPLENSAEFLRFYWKTLDIRPLWICPVRPLPSARPWTLYDLPDALHLNFGFWSAVETREDLPKGHFNRLLEREVVRLSGHKSLYSSSYFEEDEFWQIYNGPAYRALKAKYDPDHALPDLYEKTVRGR